MNVSDDPLFKSLVQNRGIKKGTIRRYNAQLNTYCKFLNKTLTELIDEAELEEDQRLRMRSRKVKLYLLNFKEYLENEGYSPRSITNTLTVVRSFYNEYEIQLPRMYLKRSYHKEGIEEIPSKEDITFALKYCNTKYKAIILLMSCSGMGSAELRSLSYHDLLISLHEYIEIPEKTFVSVDDLIHLVEEKQKDNSLIVPCWKISRIKTGTPIITFCTSESLVAILDYLKIDPPLQLESPLFRSSYKKEIGISPIGLAKYFKKINELCKFGTPNLQIKFRSHAVGRKYFATTLNKIGIPQLTIDFFLGHSLGQVTEAYIKPDVETLKNHYLKCIDALSIEDTEVRVLESEDKKLLNELQVENLEKDKLIKAQEIRLKRIEKYMEEKERIDNVKKPGEK